ncbi:hypothetical protein V4D30_01655 [Thermodesulfovibrio sp. 3907-1M]|uniref:Uncharacterized protein n=1 Tax=Thermodesulfovibrio autotrophicus TaxID=3118333 RepID=A0AAU8GXA4_9BACT
MKPFTGKLCFPLATPHNKVNFLELELLTPYNEIRKLKEKEIIEKALLYRADFTDDREGLPEDFDFSLRMDKSVWNYKRIRPANFPEKNYRHISAFIKNY